MIRHRRQQNQRSQTCELPCVSTSGKFRYWAISFSCPTCSKTHRKIPPPNNKGTALTPEELHVYSGLSHISSGSGWGRGGAQPGEKRTLEGLLRAHGAG